MQTYIVRWYVNGKADIGLVTEVDETLAYEVAKHNLEKLGIKWDHKIRLTRFDPKIMDFKLLTYGGHA